MLKGLAAALVLLLVAGCSAPRLGPDAAALRDTPVKPGQARLVLYYPGEVIGSDGRMQVKVGAKESCILDGGSYLVRDIAPGEFSAGFSFCGLPATSHLKLHAVAGEKYYIRVIPYDSTFTGILSGYPGEYNDAGEPQKVPFKIDRVDEPAALHALQSMKKVDSN